MDPHRAIVEELHAADLIRRVEALEEQQRARMQPREPEAGDDRRRRQERK